MAQLETYHVMDVCDQQHVNRISEFSLNFLMIFVGPPGR